MLTEDESKLLWSPQSPETDRSGLCLGSGCVWWRYSNKRRRHVVSSTNTQAAVDAFTATHPLRGGCGATDWRAERDVT